MADNREEFIVTEEGLQELKDELEYLKTVKRYEVAKRIEVARGYGDLSENAEYDEAKSEQGFVEGQISRLEQQLKNAVVIKDEDVTTDNVSIGTTVKLLDLDYDEEEEYHIVGSAESNIKEGKLSNVSPVGKGLLGHKVGDEVTIMVPAGEVRYRILDIRR